MSTCHDDAHSLQHRLGRSSICVRDALITSIGVSINIQVNMVSGDQRVEGNEPIQSNCLVHLPQFKLLSLSGFSDRLGKTWNLVLSISQRQPSRDWGLQDCSLL